MDNRCRVTTTDGFVFTCQDCGRVYTSPVQFEPEQIRLICPLRGGVQAVVAAMITDQKRAVASVSAYKARVLNNAISQYTGASDQRTPDEMREMVDAWQLGCGGPAEAEIPAYAARLLKRGSTLDARSAVWEEVRDRWKDEPGIRTLEEIAEILRRWPPRCGRPERVKMYVDYALNRHAWFVGEWGKEPDPKLWNQPEGE
jgi:hypothetical protein